MMPATGTVVPSMSGAVLMPNAMLQTIASPHGHDGFLIDAALVNDALVEWQRTPRRASPPARFRTPAEAGRH